MECVTGTLKVMVRHVKKNYVKIMHLIVERYNTVSYHALGQLTPYGLKHDWLNFMYIICNKIEPETDECSSSSVLK